MTGQRSNQLNYVPNRVGYLLFKTTPSILAQMSERTSDPLS